MPTGKLIGNVIKAMILLAGVYAQVNRDRIGTQADVASELAEKACRDEVSARYNVSTCSGHATAGALSPQL